MKWLYKLLGFKYCCECNKYKKFIAMTFNGYDGKNNKFTKKQHVCTYCWEHY